MVYPLFLAINSIIFNKVIVVKYKIQFFSMNGSKKIYSFNF